MNRKRDDLDPGNSFEKHTTSSLKRVKSQSSNSSHSKDDIGELDHGKSVKPPINSSTESSLQQSNDNTTQESVATGTGRKRRSRTTTEELSPTKSAEAAATGSKASNSAVSIKKKSELSCVVCYGLAHGYNFDAISCESCKAFFRRNALYNADRLKCRRSGSCEITLETRRRCKSCRLKKCFAVGMRKEWILTEEEKINKKLRIEENRKQRLATLGDSSSSNDAPVELKTNNSDSSIDIEQVLLDKKPLKMSTCSSLVSTNEVIESVVNAFNDGFQSETISYGWSYPLAKKVTGLCQILNMKNTTALRLIGFYKRLHIFDSLHEMDKVHLLKHNLANIFFFHSALGYDSVNDIYYEGNITQDPLVYGSDIREVYGEEIYSRCTSIMRSLQSIVDMDKRIIQLALVIMLFSKGPENHQNAGPDGLLKNHTQVFQAQNYYVEHLWLFMEKSYGTMKSAQTFTTLISRSLLVQRLLRDIEQNIVDKIDPSDVPVIMRTILNLSK